MSKRLHIEVALKAGNSQVKRFLQGEKIKKTINVQMVAFRHNLNNWFINQGLHIITWVVLYGGNIPCMLRSRSVLMWVIGMKNVNLLKNQVIDRQSIGVFYRKKNGCTGLLQKAVFSTTVHYLNRRD